MSKVKNVKLNIEPKDSIGLIYNVKVSFRLSFSQSDFGKQFQYAIRLRPVDNLFVVSPEEDPSPSVIYRFRFDNQPTRRVIGGPILSAEPISHTREVAADILNEDNGFKLDIEDGQIFTVPHPDEIVASVQLMTGGGPAVLVLEDRLSNAVILNL